MKKFLIQEFSIPTDYGPNDLKNYVERNPITKIGFFDFATGLKDMLEKMNVSLDSHDHRIANICLSAARNQHEKVVDLLMAQGMITHAVKPTLSEILGAMKHLFVEKDSFLSKMPQDITQNKPQSRRDYNVPKKVHFKQAARVPPEKRVALTPTFLRKETISSLNSE